MKGLIITISGKAGSGKSTVAKLLAKNLGFRHYSIGDMRRKMAKEKGLTLAELNRLGEKEDFTDKKVDEFQRELGKKEASFVIDGRTSFYFIPHSVKIYLIADLKMRAERVLKDERIAEKFKDVKDAEKGLAEREKSDAKRYKKYYGIDVNDKKNYDLVIDTTKVRPEEIVERILEFLREKKNYKI